MKQEVNYIEHHKNVNLKITETNLNATHVSLYNALFLIWNECGFDTELSINRNDVMKLSKIGSANTYTKCLKELDKLEFLNYKPSYNPLIGSKINLYRFDKGTDNGCGNGSVKSSSNGCGNSSDTLYKLLNKETIKLINNNVNIIQENLKKWIDDFLIKNSDIEIETIKEKKVVLKKEKFNFRKSLIQEGFEENLIEDWLVVRKTKKLSNTKTAFEKFLKEVEKSNEDKNIVLRTCAEKSWGGFNHQWLINLKNSDRKNPNENLTAVDKLNKALGI